jgi:hypothetical protein
VLILIICIPSLDREDPRKQLLGIPGFYFVSLAVTMLATALIIYRIVSVVKESEGETSNYSLTIEVLIESGGMYAASLAITSILYIVENRPYTPEIRQLKLDLAESFWQQILTPIAVRTVCIICELDY